MLWIIDGTMALASSLRREPTYRSHLPRAEGDFASIDELQGGEVL